MKQNNLLALVREMVGLNPAITTEEIFDKLPPVFKKKSPYQLRRTIVRYRSEILREKYE